MPTFYEKTFALRSMFFHPAAALDSLRHRPQWFWPLLVAAAYAMAVNLFLMHRIGIARLVNTALQANGAIDPQSVLEGALAQKNEILVFQGLGTLVGTFFTALVVAKVLWLILTLVGEEASYKEVLAMVAHISLLTIVVRESMMVLTVIAMRDLDGFNLQNPLATNLAFFIRSVSPATFRLLRSVDLITFANIFLLALGMSKLSSRLSIRRACALVILPWGIYVGLSLLLPFPA
jgi:hypothetical protein